MCLLACQSMRSQSICLLVQSIFLLLRQINLLPHVSWVTELLRSFRVERFRVDPGFQHLNFSLLLHKRRMLSSKIHMLTCDPIKLGSRFLFSFFLRTTKQDCFDIMLQLPQEHLFAAVTFVVMLKCCVTYVVFLPTSRQKEGRSLI